MANGQVSDTELRRSGLIRADLYALLRQQGVGELDEVGYAVFEQRGQLSVIPRADGGGPPGLVRDVAERRADGS